MQQTTKRARVTEDISPHWFRQSHATHALDAGASLVTVRDTLGHTTIATTDVYLHGVPDESSGLYLEGGEDRMRAEGDEGPQVGD